MSQNFEHLLSRRTRKMRDNAIREIFKVVAQPGMISLAGGIPAEESFPLEQMYSLNEAVLNKYGAGALQYDLTEGFTPLRKALADYIQQRHINVNFERISVFNGSQSVLDTIAKVLITAGDKIALESPSYLGAITAFNPYEPEYVGIETDEDGVIPDALDRVLSQHDIKFIYLVTTFQNPTGRSLSIDRRKAIGEIIQQHNALIVEDDPYSALRFRGETLPPLFTFAPDHVIYASTLSKIFAPGLRIGFCIAPELIRKWLMTAKQGADLHSNTYAQALASEYIMGGYIDEQLPKIIALYQPRQEAMLTAMKKYFPDRYHWTEPEGGMFIWIEGPEGIDAEDLYWKGIEQKVAFVPGKFFHINDDEGIGTMRLNFTKIDEPTIERAVKTLGDVLHTHG